MGAHTAKEQESGRLRRQHPPAHPDADSRQRLRKNAIFKMLARTSTADYRLSEIVSFWDASHGITWSQVTNSWEGKFHPRLYNTANL